MQQIKSDNRVKAARDHQQQVASSAGKKADSATPVQLECNYADNYYGDQICHSTKAN